jgi:hypothetical protein
MNYTPEDLIKAKEMMKPSGYAKHFLNLKLHPKHNEILDTLFSKKKTKVCALMANELGKTTSLGAVSILFSLHMLNASVVATSATFRQVVKQLFPALKQYSHLYPNWEFLESSIKINNETRFIGFATSDPGRWQGWHSKPTIPLFIFTDESAALDENVYQSISRCNPDYLLCAGSPLGPEGIFYRIETDPSMYSQFKHFKMTKFDALKEDGYWLDKTDIDNFIKQWGGREHPLVLSSIYAEFASNITNGLVSLSELNKSYEFPPLFIDGKKHIGIDVAGSGGDCNVLALRQGNKVEIIDTWHEPEMMRSCDRIANHLNNLKEKYNITGNQVSLDADGLGIGFISRLKDLGWTINEYHGGKTPENPQYANHISEAWMEGIKKIKNCSIILPDNQDFRLQLLSRKQLFNDKGKLKLESKKDMRARGIASPDIADAIMICMTDPSTGTLSKIIPYIPQNNLNKPRFF